MKNWIRDLEKQNFKDFKDGKYSQSYQDILIEYIFKNIGTINDPPYCVEFGFNTDSFDNENSGINVLNFIRHHKWDYLLLDGFRENISINLYKHFLTSSNICDVFKKYNVPQSPEYISIDVDSTDLWLFKSVIRKYRPMVFSVEYNCHFPHNKAITYPNDTTFSKGHDRAYGASLKALKLVAEANGYSLIWVVKYLDAFFIRNDLIDDGSDNICFPYEKWINHCKLMIHKPSNNRKLINAFLDYEVYIKNNFDIKASQNAAKDICKNYLIGNPLSFLETKYKLSKLLKRIKWHFKSLYCNLLKIR